jgi:curved DNA-binding protein CbpA
LLQYHPDAKPGHEAKFQAISEAYATLGNAEARKVYDTTMTSTSSYHPNRHHTSSPSSHYHPDYAQHSDNDARRARAGYAWEHARRTNPRHQTGAHTRYNPFTAHHAKQQDHTAHQNHNAHFDRMQAREAWRMSNMSSGARRRAEFESAQMAKEEDLRNTSSFSRAFQFVAMFLGVLWVGGTLRAGAWEKEYEEDARRYLEERKALQAEGAKRYGEEAHLKSTQD